MTYSTLPSTMRISWSFDARWMRMPIDSKFEATSSATSSSSNSRMRGCRSMMRIFVLAKFAKTVAYSQPMTPAPTITMLSGSKETTRSGHSSRPGRRRRGGRPGCAASSRWRRRSETPTRARGRRPRGALRLRAARRTWRCRVRASRCLRRREALPGDRAACRDSLRARLTAARTDSITRRYESSKPAFARYPRSFRCASEKSFERCHIVFDENAPGMDAGATDATAFDDDHALAEVLCTHGRRVSRRARTEHAQSMWPLPSSPPAPG